MVKKKILNRFFSFLAAAFVFIFVLSASFCAPVSAASDMPGFVPIVDILITWVGSENKLVTCPLPALRLSNPNGVYGLYDASLGFVGQCYVNVDSAAGVIRYGIEPGVETVSSIEIYSSSTYLFPANSDNFIFRLTQPHCVFSGSVDSSFTSFQSSISDDRFLQSSVFDQETRTFTDLQDGDIANVAFRPVYPSVYSGFFGTFTFAEGIPDFQIEVPFVSYSESLSNKYIDFESDLFVSQQLTIERVEFPSDWSSWLIEGVGGFLDAELFPGFTFGGLGATILGILLLWMFVHVFK